METQNEKKSTQESNVYRAWSIPSGRHTMLFGTLELPKKVTIYPASGRLGYSMAYSIEEPQSAYGVSDLPGFIYSAEYQTQRVIEGLLSIYFRANSNLLEAVYLTEIASNEMHYSVVLKEDTDENRATIFSILDDPQLLSVESEYPIYFQFYPQRLKDRIAGKPVVF